MKKLIKQISESSAKFFAIGLLVLLIIIVYLDIIYKPNVEDILVEAHGLLFDIVIFGILFTIYEKTRNDSSEVTKLLEELNNIKTLDDKEAVYRKVGIIKKLNKLGLSQIELSGYYLEGAELIGVNLENCNISEANLTNAIISGSSFTNCKFSNSILSNCNASGCQFVDCNFTNCSLDNIDFSGAKASSTTIISSDFQSSNLSMSNFSDCVLWQCLFKNVEVEYISFERVRVNNEAWLHELSQQSKNEKILSSFKISSKKIQSNIDPALYDTVFEINEIKEQ